MHIPFQDNAWYWVFNITFSIAVVCLYYWLNSNPRKKWVIIFNELITLIVVGWIGSLIFGSINSYLGGNFSNFTSVQLITYDQWYGGLLFVVIWMLLKYSFSKDRELLLTEFDSYAICACFGLAFGKIGCFLSGHAGCYGIATSMPWGVIFENSTHSSITPRHPTQIYSFLFHIVLFITLFKIRGKYIAGLNLVIFLVCTSIYNLLTEVLMERPTVLDPLNLAQVVYVVLLFTATLFTYLILNNNSEFKNSHFHHSNRHTHENL